MLENDWIEAIIALPTDLFYNTGIQTYVWILTNRKSAQRAGKVQLIDAGGKEFWQPMRKSLGSKRREISPKAIETIVHLYQDFIADGEHSKIFDTTEFGYREIRIERPLRLNFAVNPERLQQLQEDKTFLKLKGDEQNELVTALQQIPQTVFSNKETFEKALQPVIKGLSFKLSAPMKKALLSAMSEKDESAEFCRNSDGTPEPDSDLRDHELVPLAEDYKVYVEREVMPFVPDAWVDTDYMDARDGKVGRVGYEINFNRYFYTYTPPRPVAEIDAEIQTLEHEIAQLLKEVVR